MSLALALLLQHPCVSEDHLKLAKLLQVSKTVREAVFQCCQGRAVVTIDSSQWNWGSVAEWIGACGSLLKALDVDEPTRPYLDSMHAAIASGLRDAGSRAPNGQLLLQSFAGRNISPSVLQVLAQYSSQHLHCLEFSIVRDASPTTWLPPVAAALSQLTQLTSLHMRDGRCQTLIHVVAGLPLLKHLTVRFMGGLECFAKQTLPSQLESLQADNADWFSFSTPDLHLNLQYLTSLTTLKLSDVQLSTPDALPLQLKQLTASDATSKVLLQLTDLQEIRLCKTTTIAAQLQQLSRLTALSGVALGYRNLTAINVAAEGWSSIPVTSLELNLYNPLPRPSVMLDKSLQCLGRLRLLARLRVTANFPLLGPASRVAAALSQLTSLQQLWLKDGVMEWDSPCLSAPCPADHSSNASEPAAAGVIAAIAKLPHLRLLSVWHGVWRWPADEESEGVAAAAQSAMWHLTAATQLKELFLSRCPQLTDELLAALASSLVLLEGLDVSYNQQLTDAAMPAVSSCLQRLTWLDLRGTSMTAKGVQGLSALGQLRTLYTPSTAM